MEPVVEEWREVLGGLEEPRSANPKTKKSSATTEASLRGEKSWLGKIWTAHEKYGFDKRIEGAIGEQIASEDESSGVDILKELVAVGDLAGPRHPSEEVTIEVDDCGDDEPLKTTGSWRTKDVNLHSKVRDKFHSDSLAKVII